MPTWIDVGGSTVTFDLFIDQLTAVMLLVVTGVGLLVHVYSVGYMHGDARYERFFAYLNLFLASMLILVLGSNLLTLFLGWELVGLSSYLLIGFWFEKAEYASAAKKAFITNRVGDVSFMVAMFLAFATFGTLDFLGIIDDAATLASGHGLRAGPAAARWRRRQVGADPAVRLAARRDGRPDPGVRADPRRHDGDRRGLPAGAPVAGAGAVGRRDEIIAWIGALTALLAALIAVRQDDIKKILAYSTVSQLGFMFIAVGRRRVPRGHLPPRHPRVLQGPAVPRRRVGHARDGQPHRHLADGRAAQGDADHLLDLGVGWLAISGVPPFAGFFSKDQILTEAYFHGYGGIWIIGLVAAILTAFYMSRWFFLIFLGEPRFGDDVHPHESPRSMTVPLIVLAVLSRSAGRAQPVHSGPLYRFLEPRSARSTTSATSRRPADRAVLIPLAIVAALLGIGLAYLAYVRRDLSRSGAWPSRSRARWPS
jgi:NADH-quinone oxidoreductase subunit L